MTQMPYSVRLMKNKNLYHANVSLHFRKLSFLMVLIAPYSCCFSEKLGLDGGFKLDTNQAVPPTPAPRSARPPAPARRKTKQAPPSSSDESDEEGGEVCVPATSVSRVPATPSMTAAARSQRASKTAALSKMSAKPPAIASDGSGSDDQSDVTSEEDSSDEESS